MRGDMKFQQEYISRSDARYAMALDLFSDVISEEWRSKLIA